MRAHACLWCGLFDCPSQFDHERWWRGSEAYSMLPLAEGEACPRCGQSVKDGKPCAAAPVTPVLVEVAA